MRATGQNFNQGGSNRIPTAQQGRNTATRMGTGLVNPSSGLKPTQNIAVPDRVTTSSGLGRVGGVSGYDGRQVQDKKYFLVQLKNKNNELAQETAKFKKQIDQIQSDNQTFLSLERKYEGLTKEVRELEGTLADYNLAVDKARAGTRPEDLRSMYEHVKNQNDKIKAHLDALFIERKSQEEQINAIESQLTEIHQAAEMKLNELDPEQKYEYEGLINENRQLIGNINIRRNELEEINIVLAQAESKLRLDQPKQKFIQLKEQNVILSRKKEDLEVQTNDNNLSFPEARDKLLAKVKEDNNIITNTDKRIKEINQLKLNYEKALKEMANSAEQAKNDEEEKKKYEILYQKDREMSEFMDTFETKRRPKLNDISKIEQAIVANLEESSKLIFQISEVPNIEDFLSLQKDMDLKNDQLDKAQSTLQALQREYEQRMSELKKFEVVEEKLEIELKQSHERIKKMQEEIDTKFNRIQDVMGEKERRRQKLIKDRDQLLKMKVGLKDELNSVTYDYELKKQKMSLHEQYNGFTELEKKLALNEGTMYNLKQFIQTRTGDMNYQAQKTQCLDLVNEMNNLLLKHM